MNYMVSTYNDTLFTTGAAMLSAPAVVVAPTEKAAEVVQRLTKIQLRKPLLSRFLKNTALRSFNLHLVIHAFSTQSFSSLKHAHTISSYFAVAL